MVGEKSNTSKPRPQKKKFKNSVKFLFTIKLLELMRALEKNDQSFVKPRPHNQHLL